MPQTRTINDLQLSNGETSAESMARCVKYFKDRLHEETNTDSYKEYWLNKYDKIKLTDYANYLIDKKELLKGKSKQ